MPIKMSKVNGGTQEIKVPFGDEDLTLAYRKHRLTIKRLKALSGAALAPDAEGADAQAERLEALLDFLASVVDRWDVVDDDGAPIPPTRATFEDLLSLPALTMIMQALLAEQSPNPPSAEPSGDTF